MQAAKRSGSRVHEERFRHRIAVCKNPVHFGHHECVCEDQPAVVEQPLRRPARGGHRSGTKIHPDDNAAGFKDAIPHRYSSWRLDNDCTGTPSRSVRISTPACTGFLDLQTPLAQSTSLAFIFLSSDARNHRKSGARPFTGRVLSPALRCRHWRVAKARHHLRRSPAQHLELRVQRTGISSQPDFPGRSKHRLISHGRRHSGTGGPRRNRRAREPRSRCIEAVRDQESARACRDIRRIR